MVLDHGPHIFHLQVCSGPTSKPVLLLPSFPARSLLLGHLAGFLIPEDLLPSLHDQALAKPLFLLSQLQHLLLLGMVTAFIADTWSSLNPVSSVVILSSKKHCLLDSLQNSHTTVNKVSFYSYRCIQIGRWPLLSHPLLLFQINSSGN